MQKLPQALVLIGLLIIVAMSIYPPWVFVDGNKSSHPMGYAPIWNPPVERHENTAELFGLKMQLGVDSKKANTIDLFRLAIQIAIVSAVTGGAFFLLRRSHTA